MGFSKLLLPELIVIDFEMPLGLTGLLNTL